MYSVYPLDDHPIKNNPYDNYIRCPVAGHCFVDHMEPVAP